MITPELDPILIAIVLLPALVAVGVAVFALQRASGLRRQLQELEGRMSVVDEYFQGLSAGAVGHGQHLARVEQDLARLRSRLEQLASASESGGASFSQAIRMARKGCSPKEIMETCGLSQMEADLVVLLHKQES